MIPAIAIIGMLAIIGALTADPGAYAIGVVAGLLGLVLWYVTAVR